MEMLNLVTLLKGLEFNTIIMTDIETYPVMCSIYGIQQRSRLDSLKYFHVVDRLHQT